MRRSVFCWSLGGNGRAGPPDDPILYDGGQWPAAVCRDGTELDRSHQPSPAIAVRLAVFIRFGAADGR